MADGRGCEGCALSRRVNRDFPGKVLSAEVYSRQAPEVSPLAVARALRQQKQMLDGVNAGVPSCPGDSQPIRSFLVDTTALILGGKKARERAQKRRCKNPYVNSRDFRRLNSAIYPQALRESEAKVVSAKANGQPEAIKSMPTSPANTGGKLYHLVHSDDFLPVALLVSAVAAFGVCKLPQVFGQKTSPPTYTTCDRLYASQLAPKSIEAGADYRLAGGVALKSVTVQFGDGQSDTYTPNEYSNTDSHVYDHPGHYSLSAQLDVSRGYHSWYIGTQGCRSQINVTASMP